jgi:hypothetical protein
LVLPKGASQLAHHNSFCLGSTFSHDYKTGLGQALLQDGEAIMSPEWRRFGDEDRSAAAPGAHQAFQPGDTLNYIGSIATAHASNQGVSINVDTDPDLEGDIDAGQIRWFS